MKRMLLILALIPNLAFGLLISPKTSGRAWTAMAQPEDTLSGAFNPAGLAFIGDRWDLGVFYTYLDGKTTISDSFLSDGTYSSHKDKNFFLPEFGINKDVCECYMTLGLIGYNRNFVKTTYNDPIRLYGTSKLGLEFVQENLSPVVTIRFGGCHAIGASIDFVFQRLKINGLETFADPIFSIEPERVTNKGYDYCYGITGTLGWTSIFDNWVFIGLAYQAETKTTRFAKYKGLLPDKGSMNIPQRMMGGIAIRPIPCVTIEFDCEYVKWTDRKVFNNPIVPNIYQLPGFGVEDGVGLGWRNQIHFRFGGEWRVNQELLLRVGYSQARTPIKTTQVVQGALTANIVEQYVTTGFTWFINYCYEFSGFFGYGFENQVRGSIPFILGDGTIQLKEKNNIAGLSIGRRF
jgi:long-chain fatty acid transport protein